jgi:hypothetical protein
MSNYAQCFVILTFERSDKFNFSTKTPSCYTFGHLSTVYEYNLKDVITVQRLRINAKFYPQTG